MIFPSPESIVNGYDGQQSNLIKKIRHLPTEARNVPLCFYVKKFPNIFHLTQGLFLKKIIAVS